MSVLSVLMIALLALALWLVIRPRPATKPAAVRPAPAAPAARKALSDPQAAGGALRLRTSSSYPREVAGEGYYQAALEAICGGKCEAGHDLRCDARLVPEPDNPHDANAVRVEIHRRAVGHLPRGDAAKYVQQLAALGRAGEPAVVPARVVGGWARPGDEGAFGVYLSFTWPLRVADEHET